MIVQSIYRFILSVCRVSSTSPTPIAHSELPLIDPDRSDEDHLIDSKRLQTSFPI